MALNLFRYKPGGCIAQLRLMLFPVAWCACGVGLGAWGRGLGARWLLLTVAGVGAFLLLWLTSPFRKSSECIVDDNNGNYD